MRFLPSQWHVNPGPLYSSMPSFALITWFLFLKEKSKLFRLKGSRLFKVLWYLGTHAAGKLLHLGSFLGQVECRRLRDQLTATGSHSFWMNTNKPRAAGRCDLCSGTVVQLPPWQESSWSQLHLQSRHLNVWDCRHKLFPTFSGQALQLQADTFQSIDIIRLPSENEFLTVAITTSNPCRFTLPHENCPLLQAGSLPPKPNLLWILWPCNSMWRNLFWGNTTTVYNEISIKAFSLALFIIGKKNKLQCLRLFSGWW